MDQKPDPGRSTYGQILKSSALIGGSAALNIGIGIIRTKAMAILLGPAGFGLMGLYSSVLELMRSFAGMGVNSSGVRQIAEAVGSGDTEKIARTVVVLRKTSVVLGLLGAAILVILCRPVSSLTFGNTAHAVPVALLSIAVFFRLVADGQGALIQGMRRIADLAKIAVLGAFLGTLVGIPLVYFLREQGVVPAMVAIAGMPLLVSFWYCRKIKIQLPEMNLLQLRLEAGALLRLGLAFMASGLLTMGAAYLVRIMILRFASLESAGFYQASWSLGGLYIGFVLQAMGADFYPRLTGVANNNTECNRLVNEQALISLLLAGPGIIGTLTFAPLVISLFYSSEFAASVPILRWICLGMTLRVVIWPMGFIVLAKGARNYFFWSEVTWATAQIGLAWALLGIYGVVGAGMAFFGSYVVHGLLIVIIVRSLSGFRWSQTNRRAAGVLLPLIAVVFGGFYVLPPAGATAIGTVALLFSGIYSIRMFVRLVNRERLPGVVRRVLGWLRLLPANERD